MPEAAEPGQYLLSVRPDPAEGLLSEPSLGSDIVPISVNHDPRESDLAAGDARESIQKQLPGARWNSNRRAQTLGDLHGGREMWRLACDRRAGFSAGRRCPGVEMGE